MPRVLNSHHIDPKTLPGNAAYISVGTKWDKGYRAGKDGTKAEVLEMHKHDLAHDHQKLREIDELQDKDLVCYCHPSMCHGDILLELAAMPFEERIAWAEQYLIDHDQSHAA
jgi:hypothetical protein